MKLLSLFAVTLMTFGQKVIWHGETEFTQGQKGNQTYDLYVFGSINRVAFLARYIKVENGVHRGEFGLGRTFLFCKDKSKQPRLIITPYPGITTDKAIFLAIANVAKISGHTIVYIPDAKFYSGRKTLYQELSAGLTKRGEWQFRWESLDLWNLPTTNGKIHLKAFNRFGLERQIFTRRNSHFHISPFVDTTNRGTGLYTGFRW